MYQVVLTMMPILVLIKLIIRNQVHNLGLDQVRQVNQVPQTNQIYDQANQINTHSDQVIHQETHDVASDYTHIPWYSLRQQ